jgi:hypothetical protein
MFTYPASYNSAFPLRANFYVPDAWFVMGDKVHASRFLTFISRPLPDMLKPIYNFSGMSLSQLAQPYVDYWLGTRDSVGAMLKNFSCCVLKTDMSSVMAGNDDPNVINRAKTFNWFRNNGGLLLLDNEHESFEKHETSLAGLADLQAQAQEHMAAVAKTPIVVLLGLTPKGLNPTAEGDMKVYYDYINDMQEALFRPNLNTLLQITQLSLFGKVYDDIAYDFAPLMSMTGKEQALLNKSKTDEAVGLIGVGVVSPEETRGKIAADPDSGWDNLDVDHVEGTLTPGAGGKPGGKPGGGGGGGQDPEMQQAENAPDAATVSMDAAMKLWQGNQHTGAMGPKEGALARAAKASAFAAKQSHAADKAGSRAAHLKALSAHQRALDAHKSALGSAGGQPRIVHQVFIDAHKAAIDKHAQACAGASEEK